MKYNEKLVFPEHNKTLEMRTTITDVAYNLKAVIVHEGESISAGHYICYFKRGETWYYSSDTHVTNIPLLSQVAATRKLSTKGNGVKKAKRTCQ